MINWSIVGLTMVYKGCKFDDIVLDEVILDNTRLRMSGAVKSRKLSGVAKGRSLSGVAKERKLVGCVKELTLEGTVKGRIFGEESIDDDI